MTKKTVSSMTLVGMMAFWLIFVLAIIITVLAFTGCGGGGDDDDCATGDCPDTGPMTADANPAAVDAGGAAPDAVVTDVCAGYRWMDDRPWSCNDHSVHCNFELVPSPEAVPVCSIKCDDGVFGGFWLSVAKVIIYAGTGPADPATLAYSPDGTEPWHYFCRQEP